MIDPSGVAALLSSFSDPSDGEALKSLDLTLLLLSCSPAPFSRNQFTPGHVTCSGLVTSPTGDSLLMVHHRRLDRWLVPGGHVEPEDPEIWGAARQEVTEETAAELVGDSSPQLAGIDVHGIPSNGREPYHLHHDLIFAFQATSLDLQASEESRAVAWVRPDEFDRYQTPGNIRRAWLRLRASRW